MNALLFSMPGTPVLYYGDEIGMGDNIYLGDRNGVRTPMQWSDDRHAGFSRAHPQRLYLPLIVDHEYHHEAIHVEAQEHNHHSLLWWMKGLIAQRKRHTAFGRGTLEFLEPVNQRVLAFIRRHENEQILVVANLSRFVQGVELDLSDFRGLVPVEMIGRAEFWPIGDRPYALTLGPHAIYWFSLEPSRVPDLATAVVLQEVPLPVIATRGAWDDAVHGEARTSLEDTLPGYLRERPWFGKAGREILALHIAEAIPVPYDDAQGYITLVRVMHADGDPEIYALPVAFIPDDEGLPWDGPVEARIARVQSIDHGQAIDGTLIDAMWEPRFVEELLETIAHGRHLRSQAGTVVPRRLPAFRAAGELSASRLPQMISEEDHNNTSVRLGDRLILKLFRRLDEGTNPELEIGDALTEAGFRRVPRIAGALEYQRKRLEPMTLAVLHGVVPNEGTAWQAAQEALTDYFEQALASDATAPAMIAPTAAALLALPEQEHLTLARQTVGPFLDAVSLLGRRTAELHAALTSASTDPSFVPVPFTPFSQRSLYQLVRGRTGRVMRSLRQDLDALPEPARSAGREVLALEPFILQRLRAVLAHKIPAVAIRCHGDYHLDQVLLADGDYVFIDFEGEPELSVGERQLKRSPLRDVAAMIRSLD